jgi:hypothetical protein
VSIFFAAACESTRSYKPTGDKESTECSQEAQRRESGSVAVVSCENVRTIQ